MSQQKHASACEIESWLRWQLYKALYESVILKSAPSGSEDPLLKLRGETTVSQIVLNEIVRRVTNACSIDTELTNEFPAETSKVALGFVLVGVLACFKYALSDGPSRQRGKFLKLFVIHFFI